MPDVESDGLVLHAKGQNPPQPNGVATPAEDKPIDLEKVDFEKERDYNKELTKVLSIEKAHEARVKNWDLGLRRPRAPSQATSIIRTPNPTCARVHMWGCEDPYDVIFDDDGKGEIADVVALRITDSVVAVTLYHCKYSGTDTPGARLGDLYEVCGQAQKSARWRDRPGRMLQHMLRREKMRRDRGESSRIEQGTAAAIKKLKVGWQDHRFEFEVRIVQPGLSRQAIGEEGLHLLAGVETYLLETRAMRLKIIGSQ